MTPGRGTILLLLVGAAAAAAYAGTRSHGFVYDDHRFVDQNPHLAEVAAAPWRAFDPGTTGIDGAEPGMWRPLRTLSFALDRTLFGTGSPGPHLANALLHGVAAGLVLAVGLCLGLGDLAAAAGAAVFAFHPVQAEAVAWVSSRGDLLAAVVVLAAVLLHLRRSHAAWPAALCGLGLLAKESAAAAPLLLLAADFAAGGTARVRERWRAAAWAAGAVGVLLVVRFAVLSAAGADPGQGRGLGLGSAGTLAALPSMFAWYGWRTLVPSPGVFDFQLEPSLALSLAFLGALALVAGWHRIGPVAGGARPVRAAALWALAALLPATLLQVVFPLKILVADRFLYLAMAGPALALGALAQGVGTGACRGVLVASPLLLLATFPAAARWRSDEALWRDTLERLPGNARALHGMGAATESRPRVSVEYYRAAVDAEPRNAVAWFRLGLVEASLFSGEPDAGVAKWRLKLAVASLNQAIRLWEGGEPEGRTRGLPEAREARDLYATLLKEFL